MYPSVGSTAAGMGQIIGGSLPQATQAQSVGVHDMLNAQEKALAEAHAVCDQLAERLSTIMTPSPPNTIGGKDAAQQSQQVVHRIQEHTRTISCLSVKLQQLFQRIEL